MQYSVAQSNACFAAFFEELYSLMDDNPESEIDMYRKDRDSQEPVFAQHDTLIAVVLARAEATRLARERIGRLAKKHGVNAGPFIYDGTLQPRSN